ncbi:translocation/assembly module TamB domain-containing protein [Flavihumibacter sp. RY-1]|uniref:Translocation/assembly module TamB domain-containing protein n=1 Tax=Flavihumibacter fluminis TaxID=2909236 RepID=A0ABS9BEL7_9BACT|nr:translocation/assembly module TamB domain-containing protein [Flavihumibacter fluminis]
MIRLYPKRSPRWLRILMRILLALLLLVLSLLLFIQSDWGQQLLTRKAKSILEDQFQTRVELQRIRLDGFNRVSVEGLTVFDQQNKVLLHSGDLSVHFALLPLFSNTVVVHALEWKELTARVYTLSNDQLNYQFLLDGFQPSGKDTTQAELPAGKAWKISLGRIEFNNIRLQYDDQTSGMHAALVLKNLSWRFKETDISGGTYDFNDLRITGLNGFYTQEYRRKNPVEKPIDSIANNPLSLLIKGKLIQLDDICFAYRDEGSGIHTGWQLEQGRIELLNANVGANKYLSGNIKLQSPKGYLIWHEGLETLDGMAEASQPLVVNLQSIDLKGGAFGMQNLEEKRSPYSSSIDFNYLGLSAIQTNITRINWKENKLTAVLDHLSAKERSGFRLEQAGGKLAYENQRLSLTDYAIKTGSSQLSNSLLLYLPSNQQGEIITDQIGIQAQLTASRLALSEVLFFVPELKQDTNFRKWWNKEIRLNGKVSGNLSALQLQTFHIQDNAGNDVHLTGVVRSLTVPDKFGAELSSLSIETGKSAITSWIAASQLPANLELPERIDLRGRLSGNMNNANAALTLNSSYGLIRFQGRINGIKQTSTARYELDLQELNMNVGQWIRDTSLGLIVASGNVKGRGLDPETMNGEAAIRIQEASINGYNYQQIDITGTLNHQQYTAYINSLDTNLQTQVELTGVLTDGYPSLNGKLTINRADLQAVGLSTSPFIVKGEIDLDLKDTRPRKLEGTVFIHHVQYANDQDLIQLDSLAILALADLDSQHIKLEGPIGFITLDGNYDYTQLATAVSNIIERQLNPADSLAIAKSDSMASQSARLTASLLLPRSMEKLLPDLQIRQPLTLEGSMNTDSSMLYLEAAHPQFRYTTAIVDSFRLKLLFDEDTINTTIQVAQIEHPAFPVYNMAVTAKGKPGNINWLLAVDDAEKKPSYRVGGNWQGTSTSDWSFGLDPEIVLNKERFTTVADSAIVFRKGQLWDAAFEIQSDSQSVKLEHIRLDSFKNIAYQLLIKDFEARTISSFISKDTTLAEGTINARLRLNQTVTDSSITGTVSVDSLRLFGKPIGNVNTELTKEGASIGVLATLEGYGNNVKMEGSYADRINATIRFDSLQLASAEPFTAGATTNMSGAITGNLDITGEITNPDINGSLVFHKGKLRVSYLNNPLEIDQQELRFTNRNLLLSQFTLTDTTGGKAIMDGSVRLENLLNPGFDLGVDARNFLVLGPKSSEEQMIWGPARINSTIAIKGDLSLPKVDMQLKLVDKSAIGFVVPDEEPGIANREGVIEFVNRQNPPDSTLIIQTIKKKSPATQFSGIEFSGDIELTPASTLTIVIDPYNGDFLEVKGSTSLNVKVEQGNRIGITGVYEIEGGKYEMSLNQLIKRSFGIEKGSTITWNGDPLEAAINIRAKYQVDAPAIDLIRDQSSGSRAELTRLRQKVPIDVYMNIRDELMQPDISFELDMPEKDRNFFNGAVYTRLKQINNNESELTKQVMALLVLQTFLSENPLASLENRSGGGIGLAAKQSVSKILSQQLNTLAGTLISGIDLNFDLETREDYMSGSRQESTVLSVGASKSLFNNRLTVSVGSNIGLLGNAPTNGAQLIGDVLIEYKLSRDGRYRIRAYQQNQTDAILLGQIIETGVSFILVMDFDQFRQIFEKAKKQQENARNSE